MFVEMFAGSGELSKAVRRVMETLTDDPFTVGGTDFLDPDALHDFKGRLAALRTSGAELYFHVAPPCSTFSRARDRSARTRLRSREQPEGFDPQERRTREGNEIALATADMVKFLVNELDAKGSWEQPAGATCSTTWTDNKLSKDSTEIGTYYICADTDAHTRSQRFSSALVG